jgi:hypothetical protein
MLLTRLPRAVSAHTTTARWGCDTTARWLPSMTLSPVKDPTRLSKGWSETRPTENDRPPSVEEASTTSATTSAGSRLRS